jgi:uncharacterized protein (TIGR03067 family)
MSALIVLTAALLVTAEDAAKADLDRLQGTWQMVEMEAEGEAVPAEEIKTRTAVYEGNKLFLKDGDHVRRRGIITLNPAHRPRAINTWDQDGPYEDQTVPGIYELDADTLKVCFSRPGADRPTAFTTKSGTGMIYCVYKHKK